MNNVGAVAMLLPAVIGISRQTKVPVSKMLIPLAFASLLGGKMTLIGTPANILAAGIVAEEGLPTFGFFEFTPMGIVVLATGIIYMVLIGSGCCLYVKGRAAKRISTACAVTSPKCVWPQTAH